MVQAYTPTRVKELMDACFNEGAEGFGMQFCRMKKQYKNKETYKDLFKHAKGLPIYVTNYRQGENEGVSDEELAIGLVELAECGATLCDVMGDMFDKQDDEMAKDEKAIEKQMKLIKKLHDVGAEVLMSTHTHTFFDEETIIKIAKSQQERGVDVVKIVNFAQTEEQLLEDIRVCARLKHEIDRPYLFLTNGVYGRYLRHTGANLGCCMYLCVQQYKPGYSIEQPKLSAIKQVRDNIIL
jgi:3-dehydroquinate dehydratase